MRKFLVPAAAAAILATSGYALAASTMHDTGTVKTIDTQSKMLTLDDGKMFSLPSTFKEHGLKAGDKVTVTYKMSGDKMMASKVKMEK